MRTDESAAVDLLKGGSARNAPPCKNLPRLESLTLVLPGRKTSQGNRARDGSLFADGGRTWRGRRRCAPRRRSAPIVLYLQNLCRCERVQVPVMVRCERPHAVIRLLGVMPGVEDSYER